MVDVTSILSTKLYRPSLRPDLVQRLRLVERLNSLYPLTLIAAPAGFGKTTLVSEWIAQSAPTVAWLSLGEDDNDPARFLTYMIAALQTCLPGLGESALALLAAPQPSSPKLILTQLINDLSMAESSLFLVLDDYHLILTPIIHEALTFLIDHLPPHFYLIITSRSEPPLPLARWRVNNQLAEIGDAELRFSAVETATFLNERKGLKLTAEQIATLEQRTEGWIAGLQLAALSIQDRTDVSSFIQTFSGSHRHVLSYLVTEVLNRQPATIRNFMLQTSILNRMCGALCDALVTKSEQQVTHDDPNEITPIVEATEYGWDSQSILEELHQANLFIIPLDNEGRWYRYHHLFAEALRQRLQRTQPDLVPKLHHCASDWHEQHGTIHEAVAHALSACDFKRAVRLVDQVFYDFWVCGELATLLSWLKAVPDEEIQTHPQGNAAYAATLVFTGQIDAAEERLTMAEETLHSTPPGTNKQQDDQWGQLFAVHAGIAAIRGDWQATIALTQRALDLLSEERSIGFRGEVYYSRAVAYRLCGMLPEAYEASLAASEFGWATGNYLAVANSERNAALVQVAQGQLRLAAETYRQSLTRMQPQSGRPLPITGCAEIGYAEILYQWNDLEAAKRHVETGLILGRQAGLVDILFYGSLLQIQLLAAHGEIETSQQALTQLEPLAMHGGAPQATQQFRAFAALFHLRLGKIARAEQWAQVYLHQTLNLTTYFNEFASIVLTRVWIGQGQLEEALTLLAQLLVAAEAAGRVGSVIELLTIQALALTAQGDKSWASTVIERALTLAEPEGYVRVFVDEGEPLRLLLVGLHRTLSKQRQSVAEKNILRLLNYLDRLLSAFPPLPDASAAAGPSSSDVPSLPLGADQLSEREREVLHLLAQGLTYAAIAERLCISPRTVNRHLTSIYTKLNVNSRHAATRLALEHRLA